MSEEKPFKWLDLTELVVIVLIFVFGMTVATYIYSYSMEELRHPVAKAAP